MRYHDGVAVEAAPQSEAEQALRDRVAALEAALAATKSELSAVTAERNKLRRAYELAKGELELLRRRLFVAKAERIDTTQLEIEFAETKAKLDRLARALDAEAGASLGAAAAANETTTGGGAGDGRPAGPKKTSKGSGRPNLKKLDLIEERVEITDPALEETAERIGFEETYLLGRRRACNVRVVMAKATYKTTITDTSGEVTVEYTTVPKPRELVDRGMLAPSFIAYLLTKNTDGGCRFIASPSNSRQKASRSTTARCAATPSTSARPSDASSTRWRRRLGRQRSAFPRTPPASPSSQYASRTNRGSGSPAREGTSS